MSKPKRGAIRSRKAITRLRGYRVIGVDAFEVRSCTRHDEEFTNFAIHTDFPNLIPRGEIWVDERTFEAEGLFYLVDAMVHLKKLEEGLPEEKAYTAGVDAERALREAMTGLKYRGGKPHRRTPADVYVGDYLTLPDPAGPIAARLVDGGYVRSVYRTDYVEGGHGYVYPWVPKREIWLEHGVAAKELPFVLAHEYTELRLMRDDGLAYDPAHAIAAKVEFALREGDSLRDLLTTPGRPLTKADLPKLAGEAFHDAVRRCYRPR
ncbi:MAG TPA: hypothetical protein VGH33_00225 [Isosphaeraceae bacterium]